MADTLGTMKKAADLLIEKGAISVIGVATHGVLSGKAMENLSSSQMTKFLVSDSISSSLDKEKNQMTNLETTIHKLEVVSSARLIAKSISAISLKKSINEINLV
jgi:ribose-phosphate pyrophosphokinase